MMNRICGMTSSKTAVAALLCCVSALVTGCSTTQFGGPDTIPVTGAAIQGTVHGGQNPIIGASVQLWTVGTGGYGSAAATLGSAVTTIGPGGTFTLGAYSCPSGSTQTYITAQGGNPGLGTGTNSNIMLAAALGSCGNLSPSTNIVINEVSTAAAAFALGQYFTPAVGGLSSADRFGAPNTTQAQAGIANAMLTVNNLVTLATGNAVTTATLTSGANSVTVTPESAKLYSIANILSTCVNSAGGTTGCGTLFSDVTPSGGAAPTDTLQAAVYMSLNPTSANTTAYPTNLAAICALVTATPAFSSTGGCPGTVPTDWTVGIKYTDSATTFLVKPLSVAVDGIGNVWVLSNNSGLGGLAEMSPTGTPLANPGTLDVLVSGTNTSFIFTGTSTNPRNLAIDTANNVWFTQSSSAVDTNGVHANGAVFEYMTNGNSTGYSTGKSGYGIAIDGSNNVFVSQQSASAVYELYEFPGGNLTEPIGYPIATATPGVAGTSGSNSFIAPEYMAFDPTGNLWMTGGVAGSTFTVELTNLASASTIVAGCGGTYPCALTTSTSSNTYNKVSLGSITGAFSLSADTSSIFIADATTGNSVSVVPYASPSSETNIGSTTSFTLPHYAATDGAGNVWISNTNSTPSGGTPGGSISELSSSGAILSPITPNASVTNPGYVHTGFTNGSGIAVDPSGNVWAADSGNSVFELVGAAAPTVTPIALALKNGSVAAKP